MLAKLKASNSMPKSPDSSHTLVLMPKAKSLPRELFQRNLLVSILKRKHLKHEAFSSCSLIAANNNEGRLIVWCMVDFSEHASPVRGQIQAAVNRLLDELPVSLSVMLYGHEWQKQQLAEAAAMACLLRTPVLTQGDGDQTVAKWLKRIRMHGIGAEHCFEGVASTAEGYLLARSLTVLSQTQLGFMQYLQCVSELSQANDWKMQAAPVDGTSLSQWIRLRYQPEATIASCQLMARAKLAAKADSDSSVSAVSTSLGILQACTALQLPVALDVMICLRALDDAPGDSIIPSLWADNDGHQVDWGIVVQETEKAVGTAAGQGLLPLVQVSHASDVIDVYQAGQAAGEPVAVMPLAAHPGSKQGHGMGGTHQLKLNISVEAAAGAEISTGVLWGVQFLQQLAEGRAREK